MKSEVYSWRVSPELKTQLQREARRRNVPVASALEQAARDWLAAGASGEDETARQKRLHRAAQACFGAFEGSDPNRAENASRLAREAIRKRHGR